MTQSFEGRSNAATWSSRSVETITPLDLLAANAPEPPDWFEPNIEEAPPEPVRPQSPKELPARVASNIEELVLNEPGALDSRVIQVAFADFQGPAPSGLIQAALRHAHAWATFHEEWRHHQPAIKDWESRYFEACYYQWPYHYARMVLEHREVGDA